MNIIKSEPINSFEEFSKWMKFYKLCVPDEYSRPDSYPIIVIAKDNYIHWVSLKDFQCEVRPEFNLRWKADMKAIKMWQEKTGKTMEWPDHKDLLIFLLEELEKAKLSTGRTGSD